MKRIENKHCSRIKRIIQKKRSQRKNVIGKKTMCKKLNVSPTTLWRMIQRGEFPKPIQISPRRVGWIEEEGDTYIKSRPRAGGA